MMKNMLDKLIQFIFIPKLRKTEKQIGYKLVLSDIPSRYINGWVSWDMTRTWKKFGLNIKAGANYWTIGKIVNGTSSRFLSDCPEYQSWLGGYTVKLQSDVPWSVEDHFKLAIADQNSWLKTYGDPKPLTTIEGSKFMPIETIHIGQYSGTLYEGGCVTHSDVGSGYKIIKLWFASIVMAKLFNLSNPNLNLKSSVLRPKDPGKFYETMELRGYIAIFDVEEKVKVVLYGNGAVVPKSAEDIDTFTILKNDLLKGIQSCDIEKINFIEI
jgi:hypothetical protein